MSIRNSLPRGKHIWWIDQIAKKRCKREHHNVYYELIKNTRLLRIIFSINVNNSIIEWYYRIVSVAKGTYRERVTTAMVKHNVRIDCYLSTISN